MKSIFLLAITHAIVCNSMNAQRVWSLRECLDYAIEHNLDVKTQAIACEKQKIKLSTSKNSRLSSLNVSAYQKFDFGRSLTYNNTYENLTTRTTSLSMSTTVPLFTGFRISHQIKMDRMALESCVFDFEKLKNDVKLNVAIAYYQILYDKESLRVSERQVTIDSTLVERMQQKRNAGKVGAAEVSQQFETLSKSKMQEVSCRNTLRTDLLLLVQLLNLPTIEGFDIVNPSLNVDSLVLENPSQVYEEALLSWPKILSGRSKLSEKRISIQLAKSDLYPQVSLNGGIGTSYYVSTGYENKSFTNQFKNNFGQQIYIELSVPIFNRFYTRNNIQKTRFDYKTQQLAVEKIKNELYKEIQKVYCDGVNAKAKYESSLASKNSCEEAFKLMERKSESGSSTLTELNESKKQLLEAESNMLQAKYEFYCKSRLLLFYKNGELKN